MVDSIPGVGSSQTVAGSPWPKQEESRASHVGRSDEGRNQNLKQSQLDQFLYQ